MKIYITRHGETEWNKEGKMQGWKDSVLTEKGVENAKRLGAKLKDIEFDCIYCSPLGRTIDTAKNIKGDKSIKIVICEGLKEMGFGTWEGMEHARIEELYPEQQYNFWNQPHMYETIDGETFEEFFNRVRSVLNDIISNNSGENILIVTHAAVIKAIYSIIKNLSLEDFWSPPFMYDTCLTILEIANEKKSFILEADVSHLD